MSATVARLSGFYSRPDVTEIVAAQAALHRLFSDDERLCPFARGMSYARHRGAQCVEAVPNRAYESLWDYVINPNRLPATLGAAPEVFAIASLGRLGICVFFSNPYRSPYTLHFLSGFLVRLTSYD
ncbi:MAG: hypothetical protein JO076_09975 [Verrucomicrobia bacterium]|nr:hypothetical protein [Verrucomicrobiota bacterium]